MDEVREGSDLTGFLAEVEAEVPGSVLRVTEPLSTRYEITALQYGLERAGRRPIVVVERPVLADGTISSIPVVTNLMASRVLAARVLGVADHRRACVELTARMGAPIDPVVVARHDAPVAEVSWRGSEVDLTRLPALVQHSLDPGPYLSAAHATTWDPVSGIDNTAIQRAWVHQRSLRYFPYPSSHNWANIQRWWAQGEDAPVAFWIGAHPALDVGANQKISYPESHWSRAGAWPGTRCGSPPQRSSVRPCGYRPMPRSCWRGWCAVTPSSPRAPSASTPATPDRNDRALWWRSVR